MAFRYARPPHYLLTVTLALTALLAAGFAVGTESRTRMHELDVRLSPFTSAALDLTEIREFLAWRDTSAHNAHGRGSVTVSADQPLCSYGQ